MDAEGFIRAMKDIVAGCGAAGEGEDDSGASVRTPGSPVFETGRRNSCVFKKRAAAPVFTGAEPIDDVRRVFSTAAVGAL